MALLPAAKQFLDIAKEFIDAASWNEAIVMRLADAEDKVCDDNQMHKFEDCFATVVDVKVTLRDSTMLEVLAGKRKDEDDIVPKVKGIFGRVYTRLSDWQFQDAAGEILAVGTALVPLLNCVKGAIVDSPSDKIIKADVANLDLRSITVHMLPTGDLLAHTSHHITSHTSHSHETQLIILDGTSWVVFALSH